MFENTDIFFYCKKGIFKNIDFLLTHWWGQVKLNMLIKHLAPAELVMTQVAGWLSYFCPKQPHELFMLQLM